MTLAILCIVVEAVLPVVCAGLAKSLGARAGKKRFDNHLPREWLSSQTGVSARANAAQANSWEALAVFAPAVLAAHWLHAPQDRIDAIAIAFIVARLIYIGLYVADRASLRSLVWLAGFVLSLALFFAHSW